MLTRAVSHSPNWIARGRQRLQRRLVQLREQRGAAALALAERPLIQPHQQLGDGLVDFLQGEELALAQGGHDPALDYLNAHLRLGLVPGSIRPRRNDRHAVVLAQVAVGGIQIRLVIAGMRDGGLQVIRDHDLGHPAEELEGPHVRTDPVPQILPGGGLGEGVAAGAQHRHEHDGRLRLRRSAGRESESWRPA